MGRKSKVVIVCLVTCFVAFSLGFPAPRAKAETFEDLVARVK